MRYHILTPQEEEYFTYVVQAGHVQHTVQNTPWNLAESSRPALQRLARELSVQNSWKMRKAELVHALLQLDSRFHFVEQTKSSRD